ncbi:tryptophan halogenase family protein [uncultured Umboniibacter sp.]|uniref:tryptophan halogenase family protein n=1 Tax=uncultured Umboniibacter sp. TaxID=1798917 RepID=UPI00262EC3F5|nr:tryptophan halogenase family protein [uncultured Umboniibacter sp.]
MNNSIERVVIVGGGSAGWMTAAALAKVLDTKQTTVTLIESGEIGTVSVGEATIPQIQLFNQILGIDEDEFVRETCATFKLGIEFQNWRNTNHRYMHPFGVHGTVMDAIPFHHFWLKMQGNTSVPPLDEYSLATVAARQGKFMRPQRNAGNSPLSQINYAFHFDATLYAKYLRKLAERGGVRRIDAKVDEVLLRADNGHIDAVRLDSGELIDGDLFIDCTGFKGLLIEGALKTGFEDWSEWLPCDRAVAMPCTTNEEPKPYTVSEAQSAGWTWRIPLQHRIGNGYVYPSKFVSDDEAVGLLRSKLTGDALAEPNFLRWITGTRKKIWNKNCVAIGLSAGFIEPLESTGLHMIQATIAKLLGFFPSKEFSDVDRDTFNRQLKLDNERIRDFIILHYKVTDRDDSEFWRYCKGMKVPSFLEEKMALYQSNGRVYRQDQELFNETSWLAVMQGQGLASRGYHPLVNTHTDEEVLRRLSHIKRVIDDSVSVMPSQQRFIDDHCKANLPERIAATV